MDPETERLHVCRHGVTPAEVQEVPNRPLEDRAGSAGARVVVGQTGSGRYLRVVYVPDPDADAAFVITAYEIGPKARRALRRRQRRRP